MPDNDAEPVWLFRFGLEGEGGLPVSRALAEELLDLIIKWAEENDCQVGGGYRAPKPEER